MKKIISLILTVMMLASMLTFTTITASADASTVVPLIWRGWTKDYNNNVAEGSNVLTVTNEVYHGESGYSLKFPANVTTNFSNVRNWSVKGYPAGDYEFTFYSYPIDRRFINIKIEFNSGDTFYNWNWATAEKQADGWYKHTATFTVPEGKTLNCIYFEVKNEGNNIDKDIYMDDFTFVSKATGKNILANGDFEQYFSNNSTLPIGLTVKSNNADLTPGKVTLVKTFAADGDASLYVPKFDVDNRQYFLYPAVSPSLPAASSYKFSFKTNVQPGYWAWESNNVQDATLVATSTGNYPWYTYEKTFSSINPSDFYVRIDRIRAGNGVYFDDFKLTVDGDSTNYIANGSFENYSTKTNTIAAGTKPRYYSFAKNANISDSQMNSFFSLVNDKAADGNNSAQLTYINGDANQQIRAHFALYAAPAGIYTLSFKTSKILKWPAYEGTVTITDGSNNTLVGNVNLHSLTPTGLDDKCWYEYTITGIDASASGPSAMNIYTWRVADTILIDDVKLTREGDDTNYIKNGSFEELVLEPYPNNTLPTGSSIYNNSPNAVADYAVAGYHSISNEYAYTNNNSLRCYNPNGGWGNQWVELHLLFKNGDWAQPENGPYTFSFNAKDVKGASCVKLGLMGGDKEIGFQYNTHYSHATVTTLADGWKNYSYTVNTTGGMSYVWIRIYEPANIYLDNLSLKDALGNEYIANGDFEDVTEYDYTIQPVKFDANTNTATVYAANNKLNDNLNLTLITVINPLADEEQVSIAAMGTASIAKGTYGVATATLSEAPGAFDGIRSFVWNSDTLTPYYEAVSH